MNLHNQEKKMQHHYSRKNKISRPNISVFRLSTVILLVSLLASVKGESIHHDINPLHPSTAVVLIVLSCMFCLTFLILAYVKFCHRVELNEVRDPDGIVRSRSRFSGVDRTIIESIPFFRFSSLKGSKEGLECAVCLSRFEETEILRLLPRYKFDVRDLKSLTHAHSFRNQHTSIEEPNLEFVIQREMNIQKRTSIFNMANSFQKVGRRKTEEPLIESLREENSDRKSLHSIKHKIIVSDVIYRSRWSDVNSSDLMSLNFEMLNFMSSKRFLATESNSARLTDKFSAKEQILKIKEDMENKCLYESNFSRLENSSTETSSSNSNSHNGPEKSTESRLLDPQKRSTSEITNIPRFTVFNTRSRINGLLTPANMEKDEKVRRLWLPIARRTIQQLAGQGRSSENSAASLCHIVSQP